VKSTSKPLSLPARAFLEWPNLAALLLFIGTFAAAHFYIGLVAVLVVEGVYLAALPKSGWYAHVLAQRHEREASQRLEALKAKHLSSLAFEARSRFGHLEMLRKSIASQSEAGKSWYQEIVQKLDYLLEQFLLLGAKQAQFASYLDSIRKEAGVLPPSTAKSPGDPAARLIVDEEGLRTVVAGIKAGYQSAIDKIDSSLATERDPHNQALLEKRKEVVGRRSQYIDRIGDILSNIGQQLQLMEDTFGLVSDEVRARSPEQTIAEIDTLINQTDRLTDKLQAIAPFDTSEPQPQTV
jgi:hypothetical protein